MVFLPKNQEKMPIFKPGRRLSDGMINAQVSFADGQSLRLNAKKAGVTGGQVRIIN
jgi:hypothetical protein